MSMPASRHLQNVIESAIDFAIVVTDIHGVVTDWNAGAEKVLGWRRDEILGSSAERIFTPEDRANQQIEYEMTTALAKGWANDERWHLRADGRRFWASGEMMPLRDEEGGHQGFVKILRDRTRQHEAGERLRETEARFRTLLETIETAFAIVEVKFDADDRPVDYRFLEANAAFERQAGIDLRGKWVTEFAPNLERFWFDTYGHVAKTGEPATFENYAEAFGRWFDVRAIRVGNPAERQIAIFFNDVTERRTLAEERDRALNQLRELNDTLEQRVQERSAALLRSEEALRQSQKMEAVGQLTGGLAHDFNNLLAGIAGSLELIGIRINQGRIKDLEKYLTIAQGAATRAAALTHRLLAFSRRQTLEPKATDVNALASGMLEMIRRTVGPSIEVRFTGSPELWSALVDPSQLENALLNLCINARDAMPEGGRIGIETANRQLDPQQAGMRDMPEGAYLVLSVSDTGSGMSPEVVRRAFEPFFTTKPTGEGTGLGLSMIYGFAKQSGGQVRIHSVVGEGTTISIYLPRHAGDAEADTAATAGPLKPAAEEGETILVVDDEPSVRMLVMDVLNDLGYITVEAADGAGGLKVLQSDARIDLLVTDVGLPGGMNGRQLADAARTSRPDLRVLFITGFAETALSNNGQMDPGMAVLTKPFAVDALAARVREMIAGP